MENVSINWARDLPSSTRSAIEGLLGRSLRDDEEVSVMSLYSHPAPSGKERRVSAKRLKDALDQLADKARDVGGDEFDAAVDEAMNHIPRGGNEDSPRHQYSRSCKPALEGQLLFSFLGLIPDIIIV